MKNTETVEYPKRRQNRLKEYDYGTPNAYFITVCTVNRRNLFWTDAEEIIDRPCHVPLTYFGRIAQRCIEEIPIHYPAVSVDHYVIMPNHIHLLLQIHSDGNGRSMIAPTVSTVVRLMKGAVSKAIGCPIWQKGFYDHVIRNQTDYEETWRYIEGNPGKWKEDKLYMVACR